MELRQYWEIIRRRWWIPAALTAIAFVASAAVALLGAAAYKTELRLAVSTRPSVDRADQLYYDPVYYANLSSEYLADDLSEIIQSEPFAEDISAELGYTVLPSTVAEVTRAQKTHRLIDVTITTPNRQDGIEIAGAMVRIVNDPGRISQYLQALDAYTSSVSVVNQPVTRRGNTVAGMISEVGLRTLVGLALGLALAFLLHYLDRTIRTRHEVEELLDLPILAEIPVGAARETAA